MEAFQNINIVYIEWRWQVVRMWPLIGNFSNNFMYMLWTKYEEKTKKKKKKIKTAVGQYINIG